MKKHGLRSFCALLVCALMFAALLPAAACARGLLDTERPVSLTIEYPCAGAHFRLYRVAEVTAYAEYSFTGDFEDYEDTLEQPDNAAWRALAATLAAVAERDKLKALAEGDTDEYGQLIFSGLETGMYLAVGEVCTAGGWVYTPEAFLISLPNLDSGDNWLYDVTAKPKFDKEEEIIRIDRRILKIWDDGGDGKRPEKITVQLLCDGEVYDTVELSRENDWQHTWTGLDAAHDWKAVEKDVPAGYKMSVERTDGDFVITNKRTPPPPPNKPKLPQTGLLWWPVPVLACCGLGVFLLGWRRRQEDGQNG